MNEIGSKVFVGVITAILLGALTLIWNWGSSGGLVRTLGGLTAEEVDRRIEVASRGTPTAEQVRDAFRKDKGALAEIKGDPGPEGEKGVIGERGEQGLKGDPGDPARFPAGAVVAFDRDVACPAGWSIFEPAISRVIVGAVAGRSATAPTKDENGRALTAHQYRADGGEEAHALKAPEMPAHTHKFTSTAVTRGGWGGQATRTFAVGGSENGGDFAIKGTISSTGEGLAHNNMPPYIALYFCKKESG